jgi:aminopeptidase-like protein
VLSGIGERGGFHYKKSRRGNAVIDRVFTHVLRHCGEDSEIVDFSPYGYDERQYCSPGFDLPVGCLMRSIWGTFPEYHTSADNLSFIHPDRLAASLRLCASAINILEGDCYYVNQNPCCEPQLGRRNLYRDTGGQSIGEQINARLWVLNYCDGRHSLLDIAELANTPFLSIQEAARVLRESGLLVEKANFNCG